MLIQPAALYLVGAFSVVWITWLTQFNRFWHDPPLALSGTILKNMLNF